MRGGASHVPIQPRPPLFRPRVQWKLSEFGKMSKFNDEYSVYVGNLDFRVPLADLEELIYELFLQVDST